MIPCIYSLLALTHILLTFLTWPIHAEELPLPDFFNFVNIIVYVESAIYHIDKAMRLSKRSIILEHTYAQTLRRPSRT